MMMLDTYTGLMVGGWVNSNRNNRHRNIVLRNVISIRSMTELVEREREGMKEERNVIGKGASKLINYGINYALIESFEIREPTELQMTRYNSALPSLLVPSFIRTWWTCVVGTCKLDSYST